MNPLRAAALMGPTGTGKSALALDIAGQLGTSIASCDSMQVYEGLDIGTAKPTAAERAIIPHFLIDFVRLPAICSAARWAEAAAAVIARENEAGRRPLIVGGTGLYLRALLRGLADIPPEDAEIRRRLAAEVETLGISALHDRLRSMDPHTAERLKPNDAQRILRALAVQESTGRPLSYWQEQQPAAREIDCPVHVLSMPRPQLYRRLGERFHAMLAAGWLDEVRWLNSMNLPEHHPAVRAVGYRQLLAHVRGTCSLGEAVQDGIRATCNYAKRQETWFRHQTPQAAWGDDASRIRAALLGQH